MRLRRAAWLQDVCDESGVSEVGVDFDFRLPPQDAPAFRVYVAPRGPLLDTAPRTAHAQLAQRRVHRHNHHGLFMHIVLPGGSGQVGTFLARAFVADGHHVTVLSRSPAASTV